MAMALLATGAALFIGAQQVRASTPHGKVHSSGRPMSADARCLLLAGWAAAGGISW
jgi:hypothetical protein